MRYNAQQLRGFWSQLYLFLRTYRPHPAILLGLCLLAVVVFVAVALILFVILLATLAVALFGIGLVSLWAIFRAILTGVKLVGRWLAVFLITLDLAAKVMFETEAEATKQQPESTTQHTSSTTRTYPRKGHRVSRKGTRYFYPNKSATVP